MGRLDRAWHGGGGLGLAYRIVVSGLASTLWDAVVGEEVLGRAAVHDVRSFSAARWLPLVCTAAAASIGLVSPTLSGMMPGAVRA